MPLDRRAVLAVPLIAAGAAGLGIAIMLGRMASGSYDPHGVPSVLLNKPVPPFTLPGLGTAGGFGSADLLHGAGPVLVNFFASWCPPCIAENPLLMSLHAAGVVIWGIAYKDNVANTKVYLGRYGDPYARIAHDDPGRIAIDWGVTGVPESFLVDGNGIVRWHQAGPLTPRLIARELRPALQRFAGS